MKKNSKLRILSWITAVIMVISIFNIPLMGYATEMAEEEPAVEQEVLQDEEAVTNNSESFCPECGAEFGTCSCGEEEESIEVFGPSFEITYYIEGEEQIYEGSFYEDSTYEEVYLDYRCDAEMGIDVKIIHPDGEESWPTIEQYDENNWMADFYSVVNGEENSYTLDIYIDEPSSNNYCWMNAVAYVADDDYYYLDIDSEAAASEDGAVVNIPYGQVDEITLYVYVDSEYAEVEGLESGWEDIGVPVEVGETKVFTVTAQNGDVRTYTLHFNGSDGSNAIVNAYASFYDSALEGNEYGDPYRSMFIEFTEVAGVRTADVALPYLYKDEEGINLTFDPTDSYQSTLDSNTIYLGEDDKEIVEFDLTSPNGQATESYKITFTRETEEQSKKVVFDTFDVTYVDENGEDQVIAIDPADAADEDGATVVLPEGCITEDIDEYYANVFVELGGYGYFGNNETTAQSYMSTWDYDVLDYDLEMRWQFIVSLEFEVVTSSGVAVPYKVTLIDGAKVGNPEIDEVCIMYTGIKGSSHESWIWLEEDDVVTLEPYDASKPITLVGTGADGAPINIPVTFKDGENETVVEFTSTSYDGKNDCIYSITVIRPIHPLVEVLYKFKDEELGYECYFNEQLEDTVMVPYSCDLDDIVFDIMLLDGTTPDPMPEIVWESETRKDEHDALRGELQFQADGKTYTVNVISKGISSNTGAYMSLDAWDGETTDEYGDPDYKYLVVDEEKAATTDGATVTIPYGCDDEVFFYIYPYDEAADLADNSYEEKVSAGETRTYTVIAEDGTKQKYKVKFVASSGNTTKARMNATIGYTNKNGEEGICDYSLEFTKKDGVMVADMPLHYLYDENAGIYLYLDSDDYITINKDITDAIHPAKNKKSSFEFTVKSPNGKNSQKYKINFARESATQAAKAEIEAMDITYVNSSGSETISDVDLSNASTGKITVYVPKSANFDEYMAIRVFPAGYTEVSKSPSEMGFGDPGMFGFGFLADKDKENNFTFELMSSDQEHTKEYTITVKVGAGKHTCKWDKGTITTQPTYSKKGVKTYCCTVEGCDKTKTSSVAVLKYKAEQTDVKAALSTAEGGYDNIKLSWDPVEEATGYKIKYKKSSSSKWTTKYVDGKTTYTTPGLTDGAKYSFRVYPYVEEGGKKYVSSDYDSTTARTLKKVSKPKVTKATKNRVKVKWTNILGESGYEISMATNSKDENIVVTYDTTKGTYKYITPEKGTKFYYKVRAYKYVTVDGAEVKVYGPWSSYKTYKR